MFTHQIWRYGRVPCFFAAVLAALTVAPAYAESSAPLSLARATQMALRNAPQLQAKHLTLRAARHDARRAGHLPDPVLSVGINNLTVTGARAFNAAADSMTMRSIGLTQAIPSLASLGATKSVAQAGVQLEKAKVARARLAVEKGAATAWVQVWAAETERHQLQMMQQHFALVVTLAKARLAGGTGTSTDVLAAKSALVQLTNRIVGAGASVAAARAALQRWTGAQGKSALATAPDFGSLPVAPAELQRDLDQQRPLLGWAARKAQAQARLNLARAGKHPDWSISVTYGNRIHRPDMLGVMVGVSLPLFVGNRQDQNIDARAADKAATSAAFINARRAQRQVVASDLAIWHGDTQQIATYRHQLLPLAADRSHTALAAYRAGGHLQPWLDAHRNAIDTRVAYAKALAAWGQAWARLAYLVPTANTATEGKSTHVRLPESQP